MERVDPDGERRPADPGEVAQYDQMEAAFSELAGKMLSIREGVKRAAVANDTPGIAERTRELDELVKTQFPDAKASEVNFIMFLLGLIEQATEWTQHSFDVVEDSLRLLANVVRPTHPLRQLPGWAMETLDRELAVVQGALDALDDERLTFTTDKGERLYNVHTPDKCEGQFCVIHNPVPGPWDKWDTDWRDDWRLMTRICPHNVSHVAMEEMLRMPLLGMISHEHPGGCDCACDIARCKSVTDEAGNIIGFEAH